jgi:hypothetical protein
MRVRRKVYGIPRDRLARLEENDSEKIILGPFRLDFLDAIAVAAT